MDRLSGILDNIKERLSSPLIFSFILSWIFINWHVTVALLWYDPPGSSLGHLSLIEYIHSQLDRFNSLWLPLTMAIIYTLLSPWVRNGIRAFYAKARVVGDQWNINISNNSTIPIEKYLSLVKSVSEKGKQLQIMIEEESLNVDKLQKTENTLNIERREHQHLQAGHAKLQSLLGSLYRFDMLDGEWNKSASLDSTTAKETDVIQFSNGTFWAKKGVAKAQYQINDFIFDWSNRQIHFIMFNMNQPSGQGQIEYILSHLTYHDKDHLSGFEYHPGGRFFVEYRLPPKL